jgi:hypothetical protein
MGIPSQDAEGYVSEPRVAHLPSSLRDLVSRREIDMNTNDQARCGASVLC